MRLAPLQAVAQKTERKEHEQQNKTGRCRPRCRPSPLGPSLAHLTHPHTHPPYPSRSRLVAEAPSRGASTLPGGPGEGRRGRAGAGRQAPLPAPCGVAPGLAGGPPCRRPLLLRGRRWEWEGGHGSVHGGGGRGGGGQKQERWGGACLGSAWGPVCGAGVLGGEEEEAVPAVLARGRWSVPEALAAGTRGPRAPLLLSAGARVHPTLLVHHPLEWCPGPVVGGFAPGTQLVSRAGEYSGCGVVWCVV